MAKVVPHWRLTHEGALAALNAAVAKATEIKAPMCIAICDDGGNMLAFARMDGAKVLSIDSATTKATTASSMRVQTGGLDEKIATKMSFATQGKYTNLNAGLPIIVNGVTIGGVGAGSGTGAQDLEVSKAALAAIDGAERFADAKAF